jgi:hypothetical protein
MLSAEVYAELHELAKARQGPRLLLDDVKIGTEESDYIAAPDHERAVLHRSTDQEQTSALGVTYQKCGGGRRVIRRSRRNY